MSPSRGASATSVRPRGRGVRDPASRNSEPPRRRIRPRIAGRSRAPRWSCRTGGGRGCRPWGGCETARRRGRERRGVPWHATLKSGSEAFDFRGWRADVNKTAGPVGQGWSFRRACGPHAGETPALPGVAAPAALAAAGSGEGWSFWRACGSHAGETPALPVTAPPALGAAGSGAIRVRRRSGLRLRRWRRGRDGLRRSRPAPGRRSASGRANPR